MDYRDVSLLGSSKLFSGVDIRDLDAFFQTRPSSRNAFPKGSVALLAGCSYDSLRVVIEGEADAEMTSADGRCVAVESFVASQAIATAVLFSPNRILPVTVVARGDLVLASIPRATLLEAATNFPPVLEALLSDMGERLSALAEKYRAVSFATLRERLADWLLSRAESSAEGSIVRLRSSKERIASIFGVPRPSLSREFSELTRLGLIESKGKTVRIIDPEGLRKAAARSGSKTSTRGERLTRGRAFDPPETRRTRL